MSNTASTEVTRLRAKQRTELSALHALLDATFVGHFAVTDQQGHPVVFPTAIARDGDQILAHGSTGSPWMRALAGGASTCLAVTALDGLVVARSTFESSLHYRSAVLFGTCSTVRDIDKIAALDVLAEAMLPGRAAEVRRPWPRELAATLVLSMPIEQWSLKVSDGWPDDEDADIAGDAWAGVVPLDTRRGTPIAAPDLRAGIELPASLAQRPDAPDAP